MDLRTVDKHRSIDDQAAFFALFRKTNYRFRFFDLSLESGGDDVDVEFNYKDLAHLEIVHKTFNVFYSYISDDIYSAVILQRFLGFTFPVTAVSMQLAKNHLFVHTSVLNIILSSEIRTESLPDHRVRVNTRYGVGASRFLLPVLFPLVKWTLTRNYRTLMADDLPMRDRRGEIRRWGARIEKTSYGFAETFDIAKQHVFAPEIEAAAEPVTISLSSVPADRSLKVGRSDHMGLQLFRRNGAVEIYPRMCPHEGACLDAGDLGERPGLTCGWHRRFFRPILRIAIEGKKDEGVFLSGVHRFTVLGEELRIEPRPSAERGKNHDWTRPAVRA
jgi:nitrite reductase/ring-hydroxylating ferredoxin subunit